MLNNIKHNFTRILSVQIAILSLVLGFAKAETNAQPNLHSTWDSLLKKHVFTINDGHATQVSYAGFQQDHAQLTNYLAQLSAITKAEYQTWGKNKQLAFLINAYNAFTVELILTEYPNLKSIRDLGSLFSSPWKKDFVSLLETQMSLDDIEHGTIREKGVFDEPRIHFAVNCASIGCPALTAEAFVANKLDEQLERATVAFLNDRSRNYATENKLYLSPIFKWYKEDFESSFYLKYADELGLDSSQLSLLKQGDLPFKYTNYDWALNDRKAN